MAYARTRERMLTRPASPTTAPASVVSDQAPAAAPAPPVSVIAPIPYQFDQLAVEATQDSIAEAAQRGLANTTRALSVQRDGGPGSSVLPPMPNFQLSQGPLLKGGLAAQRGAGQYTLKLDPSLQQQAHDQILPELAPEKIRAALGLLRIGPPPPPPGGVVAVPGIQPPSGVMSSTTAGPTTQPIGSDPNPDLANPKPQSAGDLIDAMMATPEAKRLLASMQQRFTGEWSQLYTGQKIAIFSATTTVVGGAITGIMLNPSSRSLAMSVLNGKVLPVPGVKWLSVESNFSDGGVMFGLHVDVGRLLPPSWGFGASDTSPASMSGPPAQRAAETAEPVDDPSIGTRIQRELGRGDPLGATASASLAPALGMDFSQVRIHSDAAADALSNDLHARAFTTGSDIFFSSGAFAPSTPDGQRLLAHEAVHVQQQQAGPVAGTPVGGIRLSDPADPYEQAAVAAARQFGQSAGAPVGGIRTGVPAADTASALDVQRDPLGPAVPGVVDPKSIAASLTFSLPPHSTLVDDTWVAVVTKFETPVTVTLSQQSLKVHFGGGSGLLIDAQWPAANMNFFGFTYDFAAAKLSEIGLAKASLGFSVEETARAKISAFVMPLFNGTRAAAKGYDPLADTDLPGTLKAIVANFPKGSGESKAPGAKDMSKLSVAATATLSKEVRQGDAKKGQAVIKAGQAMTIEASLSGTLADLPTLPEQPAKAISAMSISAPGTGIVIELNGKPLVALQGLGIARGGQVTVTKWEPLGVVDQAGALETTVNVFAFLATLSEGGVSPMVAGDLQPDIRPKFIGGLVRAELESALTQAVQQAILDNRRVIPDYDLAEILGVQAATVPTAPPGR